MTVQIDWDIPVTDEYLRQVSIATVTELAPQVDAVATSLAPVLTRHGPPPKWAKRIYKEPGSHFGHGGHLKASVHWAQSEDGDGIYADILSLWYGRFLDPKAEQLHYKRPFLPTALYAVCQGRVLYLG
jgi:hypothetical protein